MKLKVVFTYDVNPETGEMTLLCKEEVTVDTTSEKKTKKSTTKKVDNGETLVMLETNKLVLTQGAADLLQVYEDCRIDIRYDRRENKAVPVIAVNDYFPDKKGGNKLSKSNTVSYRGLANEKLSSYGTTFKLEPTEKEGVFYLVGDKEPQTVEVPDEIINIEDELDIDTLDVLDTKELGGFDFSIL